MWKASRRISTVPVPYRTGTWEVLLDGSPGPGGADAADNTAPGGQIHVRLGEDLLVVPKGHKVLQPEPINFKNLIKGGGVQQSSQGRN